ncbi:DUF3231 family protein [Oceanobacillus halotolerans]|uniref:DUF3231 family protein n=1 Tax=Oceanobacillus halotolerans TaxID=2663380 RepID=UPI0013DB87E0|nr:DUF3231 family protein [Oceanobacillus halotolerans]
METEHKVRLTSAEISTLWNAYINNSMSICMLRYFNNKVEDKEIKSLIERTLEISQKSLSKIKDIFREENYPIPIGFTDKDVNLEAPRLFSDEFFLHYIDQMTKPGFTAYGFAAAIVSRLDIQALFNEFIQDTIETNKRVKKMALEKGVHLRPPHMNKPKEPEYVNKQSFLTGWFGNRKPLLGIEITQCFHDLQANAIGKALITGFAQTAETKDVRDYFKRGKEISNKHIKVITTILTEEDIPVPRNWDDEVISSTEAPFSDKLMIFHVSFLSQISIGNYGTSISQSTRRDLITHLTRLMGEIGQYVEDGANLMIKHGWLEQPPKSVDKNDIIK